MAKNKITRQKRILVPVGVGLLGAALLSSIYFVIVSWAESFEHALEFFWQDRWIVVPIILGFGIQAALYSILKLQLYLPVINIGQVGSTIITHTTDASVGASGTTSTIAMLACCAHHVTDVLPILGLTAASTFLAEYRAVFMFVGLGMTLIGIGYMLYVLHREKQKVINLSRNPILSMESE